MENTVSLFKIKEEVWILQERNIKKVAIERIAVVYSEKAAPRIRYNFSYKDVFVKWVPEKEVFKTKKALVESLLGI